MAFLFYLYYTCLDLFRLVKKLCKGGKKPMCISNNKNIMGTIRESKIVLCIQLA